MVHLSSVEIGCTDYLNNGKEILGGESRPLCCQIILDKKTSPTLLPFIILNPDFEIECIIPSVKLAYMLRVNVYRCVCVAHTIISIVGDVIATWSRI